MIFLPAKKAKKIVGVLLVLCFVFFFSAGCNKAPKNAFQIDGGRPIKAGMVIFGSLKDLSFNDSAYRGLLNAKDKLGAEIELQVCENEDQIEEAVNFLASAKMDIIIAVGYKMNTAIRSIAPSYPNIKFVIIDGDITDLQNVCSINFREEEGAFLVGVLAAQVSNKNTIGFIGGEEKDIIKSFEAGYKLGAKSVNPDVNILVDYTGSFDNPEKGKELALKQFENGADIIFHASGACGIGVIQAANEKGVMYYAIGVDSDQDALAPGRVLTSMILNIDDAVYNMIEKVKAGGFVSGNVDLGLKEDALSLSSMQFTASIIPLYAQTSIDDYRNKIIKGEIKVSKNPDEISK